MTQTAKVAAAPKPRAASHEAWTGVPEGYDGFVLGQLAAEETRRALGRPAAILHVARDDRRMEQLSAALAFFAPKHEGRSAAGLGYGALRPDRPQRRDRRPAHHGAGRCSRPAAAKSRRWC